MERIRLVKSAGLAGLSMAGSLLVNALGGWDVTLQVLVGSMAVDYLTGLIVAGAFQRSNKTETGALDSGAGFRGLMRKCAVLLVVFLAVLLDRAVGASFVRPAVCLFFTANEGISVLENLGLMGVPYPAFLRNMLEALKQRGDKGGVEDSKGEKQNGNF